MEVSKKWRAQAYCFLIILKVSVKCWKYSAVIKYESDLLYNYVFVYTNAFSVHNDLCFNP